MTALLVSHEPSGVGAARRRVVAELVCRGLPRPVVDDVALVLSELVGNAVRHGAPLPDGGVLVLWEVTPGAVRVEVRDGGGHPVPFHRRPSTSAEGGRGMVIVAAVAGRCRSEVRDGLTCVEAELPIGAPGERYATA